MQEPRDTMPAQDTITFGWALFEAIPDCVKLLDTDGAILAMNCNGRSVMEIDDIALLRGQPWISLWPAQAHAALQAALDVALAGGAGHFSAACPTAKGTPKWWDVMITRTAGPAGLGPHLLAISRDITEQRNASEERERLLRQVQAANSRMEDIFRQAPAFMCVLRGPEHVFEMINDRYLQLVGNRDPIGLPVRAALPELTGQGFYERLDAVYCTGESFHGIDLPVMLARQPGAPLEQRYIDHVYMALRDADGQISGILVHGVDQTHRVQAELALHASHERFEKIVSQAATGVVQIDPQGCIVLANQKFCQMVGRSEAELIGTRVEDITAPQSRADTLDALARLAGGAGSVALDKYYLRNDDTLQPATSSVNALRGPDGQFQGLVAIVLDTTESKRVEEQLRASEERYRTLFESVDEGQQAHRLPLPGDEPDLRASHRPGKRGRPHRARDAAGPGRLLVRHLWPRGAHG
jgi:PAS domain S-box-containing protein